MRHTCSGYLHIVVSCVLLTQDPHAPLLYILALHTVVSHKMSVLVIVVHLSLQVQRMCWFGPGLLLQSGRSLCRCCCLPLSSYRSSTTRSPAPHCSCSPCICLMGCVLHASRETAIVLNSQEDCCKKFALWTALIPLHSVLRLWLFKKSLRLHAVCLMSQFEQVFSKRLQSTLSSNMHDECILLIQPLQLPGRVCFVRIDMISHSLRCPNVAERKLHSSLLNVEAAHTALA